MKSIQDLIKTPRMFYVPLSPNNSVEGLMDMCLDIMKSDFIVVEIGSFSGVSSNLFARFCHSLFCVDIWDADPTYQEIDPQALRKAKEDFSRVWVDHVNIFPIQGFSLEASSFFLDGTLDMVYIDGRHDYPSVKADIQAWIPKIKPGGWLTGHDIDLDGERVLKAVTEIIGNDYKTYKDTSWAHQLK